MTKAELLLEHYAICNIARELFFHSQALHATDARDFDYFLMQAEIVYKKQQEHQAEWLAKAEDAE